MSGEKRSDNADLDEQVHCTGPIDALLLRAEDMAAKVDDATDAAMAADFALAAERLASGAAALITALKGADAEDTAYARARRAARLEDGGAK